MNILTQNISREKIDQNLSKYCKKLKKNDIKNNNKNIEMVLLKKLIYIYI